jgi:hypothetical protein
MAFLAPLAGGAVAKTAGAAALAKAGTAATASSALGAGITAGTALGGGSAMAAMPALSYAGANLAAPGILGALPSAVAPTAGIFAKAAPALGGLKAGTTIPGLASTAPGATGLKSLAGGSQLAGQAGNISNQMYNQLVQQFGRPGVGQNLTQVGPQLAGKVDSLAFKPVVKEAPFLNTFSEGAALPGVTSNLPGATWQVAQQFRV